MGQTKIEWTDVTINPFPGCRKISPGCDHCYAEQMAMRLKAMGVPAYQTVVDANGWTGQVGCNPGAMLVPGKNKRIFCQSMGDLFYEGVTDEQRDSVFSAMLAQSQHTWQVLTKRLESALAYYEGCIEDADNFDGMLCPIVRAPNIWFGWTAENQEWLDRRTPVGLRVPATVRFVSCEPLLSDIDFGPWIGTNDGMGRCTECGLPYIERSPQSDTHARCGNSACSTRGEWRASVSFRSAIDWVIVGCESGPRRRPCDTQWVADLFSQCVDAGVPRFIKQISIDGKVVKDANRIAKELSGYFGSPLCAEDIRQFPLPIGEQR